ncbi:MAG: isopentenyl phosphate kinase [Candidatus Diapherotrites archaeon]
MNLILLKLGGSAITKKAQNKAQINKKLLHNIALELKKSMNKNTKLILIHGAGPFGHTLVKKYKINNGVKSKKQLIGFCKTRASVQKLNNEIVSELTSCGIPAVSINSFDVLEQKNKKITKFDLLPIKNTLNSNSVPVLFGDMVKDSKLNFSVVSGDAIISFLAKQLKAKKIFFGTDVNGIFTKDPKKYTSTKKVNKINNANYRNIFKGLGKASTIDVTGGMKGKVMELKKNLKGVKIIVFDLTKKENLVKVFNGIKGIGTEIYFK